MAEITIATYNVNSIRSRLPLVIQWLEHVPVDVLALQEIKTEENKFPFEAFGQLGYECQVYGQKTYNGVAICSRLPMKDIEYGIPQLGPDQPRRFLAVTVGDIRLFNVYFPHGDFRGGQKYYYKLEFYQQLTDYLKQNIQPLSPVCILGDFNIAPTDLDVWDHELLKDAIGTMAEERAALDELKSIGFYDAFRWLRPDVRQYSWWDYVGGAIWQNRGMRIDFHLVTEPLLSRIKEVDTDLWPRRRRTPTPSDHAPVVLKIRLDN